MELIQILFFVVYYLRFWFTLQLGRVAGPTVRRGFVRVRGRSKWTIHLYENGFCRRNIGAEFCMKLV